MSTWYWRNTSAENETAHLEQAVDDHRAAHRHALSMDCGLIRERSEIEMSVGIDREVATATGERQPFLPLGARRLAFAPWIVIMQGSDESFFNRLGAQVVVIG